MHAISANELLIINTRNSPVSNEASSLMNKFIIAKITYFIILTTINIFIAFYTNHSSLFSFFQNNLFFFTIFVFVNYNAKLSFALRALIFTNCSPLLYAFKAKFVIAAINLSRFFNFYIFKAYCTCLFLFLW